MARVDVEEIGAERLFDVIRESEAEQIDIERHHRVDIFHRQHGMAETERPGAEARDRTARLEWRLVDLGAVKRLQPIAGRVPKRNQRANAPLIRKRLRLGRDRDAFALQPRGERIERGRIANFPAEEARAFAHRTVDDDELLAVVHPERQQGVAALYRLQADKAGPELPPILEMV